MKLKTKKNVIKKILFLSLILSVSILVLAVEIEIEPLWNSVVKIAKSAFGVDPTPQPGSNIKVCTSGVSWGDMCSFPLQPILSWNIVSGTRVSYAVQVDNNGWLPVSPSLSFPSPEVDTGEIVSISQSYAVPIGKLAFNTTYFWQVAIKDNFGSWSGWTEDDTSFTTTKHAWPSINFSWAPQEPSIDEEIQFADQSTVYGGATKSAWSWSFDDGNPSSSVEQNPVVQFTDSGSQEVILRVTDSDGYVCSKSQTVGVQEKLPDWKEVLPW